MKPKIRILEFIFISLEYTKVQIMYIQVNFSRKLIVHWKGEKWVTYQVPTDVGWDFSFYNWLTLQKREVCAQLFDPSKCFKICQYLWKKKTHVGSFFIFHLEELWVLPYKCPGPCRHRPGHSFIRNHPSLRIKLRTQKELACNIGM